MAMRVRSKHISFTCFFTLSTSSMPSIYRIRSVRTMFLYPCGHMSDRFTESAVKCSLSIKERCFVLENGVPESILRLC